MAKRAIFRCGAATIVIASEAGDAGQRRSNLLTHAHHFLSIVPMLPDLLPCIPSIPPMPPLPL
jgi:hypothetical protein